MATPDDIEAGSEYVRLADELVQVPGTFFFVFHVQGGGMRLVA